MNELTQLYHSLSKVMSYPQDDYKDNLATCLVLLDKLYPEQIEEMLHFASYVENNKEADLEELYVRTFDVNALCCLDVGYVMFGEDYKRGQFMAELKSYYREKEIDCGTELPDHLPNIMRLLTKLDYADGMELVSKLVVTGVEKMITSFDEDGNVFQFPLKVVKNLLKKDYLMN